MASTERVLNLLQTPIDIEDGTNPLPVDALQGDVHFAQIDFAYPEREPILKGFELTLRAGQTVGVVGATGAGKTTLINLLMRFYDPQVGEICLDGHRIQDLRISELRQGVGLVSQSTFLFHGSVRDNIRYGNFEATDEQIQESAISAEAHDFIMALPQGYDTIIGERGQTLSGGQRQRISIARVLLKDPKILILDEATSAVDNETEAALQRSIERIARKRTTLIIAHRLSTVRQADRIIVLDDGAIVEDGDHDALVEAQGQYAHLWSIQTGQLDHTQAS
jgi:ATP-binding cassette subfamily B protein